MKKILFNDSVRKNILIYYRRLGKENILVVLNFGFTGRRVNICGLNEGEVLFSTVARKNILNEASLSLKPYEGLVIKLTE